MNTKELTTQDVLRQQRAARLVERTLPDQIRSAYEGPPGDDRERARSAIVARGHLTLQELDRLPVEEAITTAVTRVRVQIASLEQQGAQRTQQAKGRTDPVTKPLPRLRRPG